MAPLPEELGAHGLNRTDQSQSYPKLRKSDLWRRTHGAVPTILPLDIERTKTVRSGPSGSAAHTATRRRAYQDGTSRPEWQCLSHGTARSGPSGSATHTATRRRAYRQHALTLPLDVERTEDVALTPDDLAYAEALPRAVPGHPRLAGPMTSSGNVPL